MPVITVSRQYASGGGEVARVDTADGVGESFARGEVTGRLNTRGGGNVGKGGHFGDGEIGVGDVKEDVIRTFYPYPRRRRRRTGRP